MGTDVLSRIFRRSGTRQPEPARPCHLCHASVPPHHRHLLDIERELALCVCEACQLLFAPSRRYPLIPERRIHIDDISTAPLGVPVSLAYFVSHTNGAVVAHYPSPLERRTSAVDERAWQAVADENPSLRELAPEVEALLVNIVRGRHFWIVPIDDCLRLNALVQREWTGLSGGSRMWPTIERFFDELTERSQETPVHRPEPAWLPMSLDRAGPPALAAADGPSSPRASHQKSTRHIPAAG